MNDLLVKLIHLVRRCDRRIKSSEAMVLIYAILAWAITVFIFWTIIRQFQAGIVQLKRLHKIPCYKCKYFTNSHYLKCTVNPEIAGSEAAINCRDYQLKAPK
jgi:hypothetical protein